MLVTGGASSLPAPAQSYPEGLVALSLHFPTLLPTTLEMNVAKMVVLLVIKCSWNKQPEDVRNGMLHPVSVGNRALPPTWGG